MRRNRSWKCMWIVTIGILIGRVSIASADFGSLFVQWAAVIDNGEGSTGGSKWDPSNWGQHGL